MKYKKSIPTINKYFDQYENYSKYDEPTKDTMINLVFDGTFFTRDQGLLVFRANGKNIHSAFINRETVAIIIKEIQCLINSGYNIKSFTIDGRKGVIKALETYFPATPIQLCQFHQRMIIRRYLTNNPQTDCGKELKRLLNDLTTLDKESFSNKLNEISQKYEFFLKERNENNEFMHKRIRSAFRSLRTNIPYLFTYRKYPKLTIPNTTNSCEGSFSHFKGKVKIHRGLRMDRKQKMILDLLKNS